jgi:hypothetical protein
MCKPSSTWSHSFSVPVSRSLQVSLLASQPTESAAGGEPCGDPAISHDSHHVSLVQWTTCLLPVTRDTGSNPLGRLMWNRDSPVSVVSLQYFHSYVGRGRDTQAVLIMTLLMSYWYLLCAKTLSDKWLQSAFWICNIRIRIRIFRSASEHYGSGSGPHPYLCMYITTSFCFILSVNSLNQFFQKSQDS